MTISTDKLVDSDDVNLKFSNVSDALTALLNAINNVYQVGDIKASVKSTNHGNWLLCNGQAVSRTTYSKLFTLIGTNFGSGDGSTTFNVPDYRGKFLRGLGGNSAGSIYTTQVEGLPSHYHYIANTDNGHNTYVTITNSNYLTQEGGASATQAVAYRLNGTTKTPTVGKTSVAQSTSTVYGQSSHVTPINQAVYYFIKAKPES